MKFQPDRLDGVNTITRHDGDAVWVGAQRFGHSVLVPWIGEVQPWAPRRFEELDAAMLEQALALKPEVMILGTGARHRFPRPTLLAPAIARRIGVESMDLAAACRTYNVLVSEGRSVLAALLLEPG